MFKSCIFLVAIVVCAFAEPAPEAKADPEAKPGLLAAAYAAPVAYSAGYAAYPAPLAYSAGYAAPSFYATGYGAYPAYSAYSAYSAPLIY